MKDNKKEIRDDEFRVIGKADGRTDGEARRRNRLIGAVSLALVLLIGLFFMLKWPKGPAEEPEGGVFDPAPVPVQAPGDTLPLGHPAEGTWTERVDTVINDVHLALFIPHNAVPELTLGVPSGEGIILTAQAADVKAEDHKILGAFVLKGRPLAWGLSKKGYCAIIDGKITVGTSENSHLFEEATEKEGYFFRQYPLVDKGVLVENEHKNKTMRKGLCCRAGQVFVAVSMTDESFHDFSQALVDLGVEDAVYLVGGHRSGGWWTGEDGATRTFDPEARSGTYANETYIIWK